MPDRIDLRPPWLRLAVKVFVNAIGCLALFAVIYYVLALIVRAR